MKHTIITGALLLASVASNAQEVSTPTTGTSLTFKSKNGHEVLPQAKDWALGISATSFLNYFGNLLNGNTTNNAPTFNTANTTDAFAVGNIGGVALSGKYMKTNTMAYRARFQANIGQSTYRNFVMQDVATPDPLNPKMVEDNLNVNSYVVLLSAGFEKRRGSNRLQGFYGAEAMFGINGMKRNYTYGNSFSSATPTPTSTTDYIGGGSAMVSSRSLEVSTGNSILGGVRGFGGVEYFFAPKISLGGEIGYTVGFSTNGKGYTTRETLHPGTGSAVTVTTDNYRSMGLRSMGIGLDNVNAGINLHFYF